MGLPFLSITAASAGVGYALSTHLITIPQLPNIGFAGAFVAAWTIQLWLWALWAVVLYPHYLSPLRHLPSPPGGSYFNGQFKRISAEPSGVPMIDW
jgi:hypothetical protein